MNKKDKPHMLKDSFKVILYPSQSYLLQYTAIFVLLFGLQAQLFIAIYKNALSVHNALVVGIPITISLVYILFHFVMRKIIITHDSIENVRVFPMQSKRLYFSEIISYKVYNSINFGGNRTGNTSGITFQTIDNKTWIWNISGFDFTEIKKYLSPIRNS